MTSLKLTKPDFFYLESDGQIFLVKQGRQWRFPKSKRELPSSYQTVSIIPVGDKRVLFAHPILKAHPFNWFHKDEIIGRRDVDPVVQQAVNRTLPRAAAKVAIIERGRVFMVKAARGLTKGMWNLPGGFVSYGEHPAVGAQREVLEETGIRVKLVRLLGMYSDVFPRTGGYMISFVYLGKRLNRQIRLHPEEMETAEWMPLREAIKRTHNPFAHRGLRDYISRKTSV